MKALKKKLRYFAVFNGTWLVISIHCGVKIAASCGCLRQRGQTVLGAKTSRREYCICKNNGETALKLIKQIFSKFYI